MIEGLFDRSGQNAMMNFLKDRLWNYVVSNTCLKIKMTNKTAATSVRGMLVKQDPATDNGFIPCVSDDQDCVGVVYENGIAADAECFIAIEGVVEILIKDTTAVTRGQWIRCSTTAGRGAATALLNDGIGTAMMSYGAGTDVMCKTLISCPRNIVRNSRFSVSLSQNQSIPKITFTKITWGVSNYDGLSEFDITTNYRFQPKITGFYHLDALLCMDNVAPTRTFRICLYKDGAQIYEDDKFSPAGSASALFPKLHIDLYLTTSNYIEIFCYQTDTVARDVLSSLSYFTGHRFA